MNDYVNSPIYISERYDVTYTFNEEEGLVALHKSRRALRARSVLAMAYMQANIGYSVSEDGSLLFYGEKRAVNDAEEYNRLTYKEELVRLDASRDTEHVGYYILPRNEDCGWSGYCGYAAAFLNGRTPQHCLFDMYHMIRHSINYLNRNTDMINNILSTRYR